MKTITPQFIIDAERPTRESKRPAECKGQDPCWVDKPYEAIGWDSRPNCATCGGDIKSVTDG